METIFVDSNIKINNITIFQRSIVWNSVANNFIYRCAKWFWEFVVIIWWWVSIVLDDKVMNCFINFVCGNSWANQRMTKVQSLTSKKRYFTKSFNLLGCFNFNLSLELWFLLFFRNWSVKVVWFHNLLWNRSFCWDNSRSQWSWKFKRLIFLLCLLLFGNVTQFMNWPRSFKAVLRTEERWF